MGGGGIAVLIACIAVAGQWVVAYYSYVRVRQLVRRAPGQAFIHAVSHSDGQTD